MVLPNREIGGSGDAPIRNPNTALQRLGGGLARQTGSASTQKSIFQRNAASPPTRSGGGTAQSSNWHCPEGADLVRESTGSGNLVCRWRHNGAEFRALSGGGGGGGGGGGVAATGGGGGGGGSAAAGASSGTTSSSSEWLQAGADTFARNPEAMLADLLERQYGPTRANALYEQLRPYADAANVLFLAHRGQSAETGTQDDFLNYLENYWDTLQTPGGRIDYNAALRNIGNPAEGSPLHAYLTTGNPEDQAGNYLRLMAGVAQTGYHPLIAQAVMDRLGLEADRYIGASARGQVDPFYQTLSSRIPGVRRLVPYG